MGRAQGGGPEDWSAVVRRFQVIDAPQRSPEWHVARLGLLTGSAAKDMLATIKSSEAAARRDLRARLVVERLTGQAQEESFVNAAMQRGIDVEPLARAAYEAHTGLLVQETGFLRHLDHMAGCSLDGHVWDYEGIVEIKCPKSATHLRYLRTGTVPSEHLAQVRHNLWITHAEWCDFVSFDDRFPEHLRLVVTRIQRDACDIDGYAKKALAFLSEVEAEYQSCFGIQTPGVGALPTTRELSGAYPSIADGMSTDDYIRSIRGDF
jgi:hypothetical protein